MLGALIMFGMQPGPLLMTNSGDIVWAMIAGLVLANFFCSYLMSFLSPSS